MFIVSSCVSVLIVSPAVRYEYILSLVAGVRQQPVGERRARGPHSAGRQLRRQQHGAGAADPHAEHAGDWTPIYTPTPVHLHLYTYT